MAVTSGSGTSSKTPLPAPPYDPKGPIENACQWFMGGKNFCDKIKKEMRCDGNVRNCPFCK